MRADTAEILYSGTLKHHGASQLRDGNGIGLTLPERPRQSLPDGRLVETVELTERPFYVGVQYHPEFKSRPNHPHPLFLGFVGASVKAGKGGER